MFEMKRREFITLVGGAAVTWPLAARSQLANKVMRVGFFGPGLSSPATIVPYQAFVARLREHGFNEGQNIVIEYRNLDDPRGPFVAAADLMRLQPDLIVAFGPEIALQAVVGASRAVPIVIIAINYDPIARGYVTSLYAASVECSPDERRDIRGGVRVVPDVAALIRATLTTLT